MTDPKIGDNINGADSGKPRTSAGNRSSLNNRERMYVAVAATAILIIIALLVVVFSLARNPSPLQRCKGIVYLSQRSSCIQDLAISTSNASICSSIQAPYQYSCIDALAQHTNNVTICDMINDNVSSAACITNLSISNKNAYYCTGIQNDSLKSDCIYSMSELGYITNKSYCDLISNRSEAEKCSYIYEFDTALARRNGTYCTYLPNTGSPSAVGSSILLSSYPGLSNLSFTFFTSYANLTNMQLCYTELYELTGDSSYCSSLTGTAASICMYGNSSSAQSNSSQINILNITQACNTTNPTYSSSLLCEFGSLLSNASKSNNYTACLSSSNIDYTDICLTYIAVQYNDINDCNYISDASLRSMCINNVTKST